MARQGEWPIAGVAHPGIHQRLAVHWLYENDASLHLPYQENLSALLHEPTFKTTAGGAVFNKAVLITRLGNLAVHSQRPVAQFDSITGVRELFHVGFWLARTYARAEKPPEGLTFKQELLPSSTPASPQTREQLQKLAAELAEKSTKLSSLFADKEKLSEELEKARREVAEIKKQNAVTPDQHDYSEAQTRDYFIDLLLKESGCHHAQIRKGNRIEAGGLLRELPHVGQTQEAIEEICGDFV